MKILIIHNKYMKYSGEEAVVDAQISLLRSKGHKVICFFKSSEEIGDSYKNKIKAFFSAFHNENAITEIKKIINKEKPEIVHIHNLFPLISPAILPVVKKMGIPIVMTVHNYRLLCPNGLFFTNNTICEKCTGIGKELNCITNNCEGSVAKSAGYALRNMWARTNKYYLDNVDAYLCLTRFQKNKLALHKFESNKCFVVPNMYNKKIIDTDYKIMDRNYIAFAGRISPEKGISILLKVAKKLPHIKFKLAGQIRKGYQIKEDIPKNVVFKGMLNSKQMISFYTNARIYLHTSICYEGFPMVFPEAMAFKLPIIAPNLGSYPEIIEENVNGLLYEPENIDALCRVISSIWDNEKKLIQMSNNGFHKMTSKYNAETYYKMIEAIYLKKIIY